MKTILMGDLLIFEFWRKGEAWNAHDAAKEFVRLAKMLPKHRLGPSIGGYENDPRELIDIPEALEAWRDFATFLAVFDPVGELAKRFEHECMVVCLLAAGRLERGQINIVPRSGAPH